MPGFLLPIGMPSRPPQFRPHGFVDRKMVRREADSRRGSARERGYNVRWEKARRTFLSRAPLCLGCEAVGRVEAAVIVDHVVPHGGDSARFWNTSLWQACCKWHHDVVKQRLEDRYVRGAIDAAALWLNSPTAIAMTKELRPAG
jgi:5-methylcytosine-specific restriction protein A